MESLPPASVFVAIRAAVTKAGVLLPEGDSRKRSLAECATGRVANDRPSRGFVSMIAGEWPQYSETRLTRRRTSTDRSGSTTEIRRGATFGQIQPSLHSGAATATAKLDRTARIRLRFYITR